MLFVIRFVDKLNRQEVREQHLDAHLSWLAEQKKRYLSQAR
jgi:uncharacterized protein YciI